MPVDERKGGQPRERQLRSRRPMLAPEELPTYTDVKALARYVDERGKVLPRSKTNLTAKQQRFITREVKRARFLALLPYTQVLR